ncbi:hypothetical protein TNCT_264211 [Trichonephila clavata]|uniref:Uncharacterized protein n=1 Tax=Trichonephila clavata TaxID=2740835 RepID=A0A8X6HY10_TRICU|nr:hypothetical protein TNCT_264211 [Trichonephila clavata]
MYQGSISGPLHKPHSINETSPCWFSDDRQFSRIHEVVSMFVYVHPPDTIKNKARQKRGNMFPVINSPMAVLVV